MTTRTKEHAAHFKDVSLEDFMMTLDSMRPELGDQYRHVRSRIGHVMPLIRIHGVATLVGKTDEELLGFKGMGEAGIAAVDTILLRMIVENGWNGHEQ